MARFSEQFIRQVAQATDIVELVSQYVALKKKGREFVGLCPFHEDSHPSMYVVPAKQIFHCFVCQTGGGVFQWMALYEKLSFPEAVRALAERANIPLPRESAPPVEPGGSFSKNDLLAVTTFAARWFRSQLQSPAGAEALDYARQRGFTDKFIERFGLGYAPDSWDSLIKAASREGIGERKLLAAGLVAQRERSGSYDRFRNRLIFPILDPQGRVIAFGGRALAADERAKYLNSPETLLFDKSGELYALNWSREAIVSSGQAIVVEGYLDALIPLQVGVGKVVATLGTALTERHVRILGRYAKEAVLVFDADAAGQAAAERALEMFLAQRLHVRVATIPAGKDPCDYCLAEGADAFRALVAGAPDALQYVWQRRQEAYHAAGGNLADGGKLVEDFLRLVVSSSAYGAIDEVRRGQLAQHIGHMLNIAPGDLQQQMRRLGRQMTRSSGQASIGTGQGATQSGILAQRHILEAVLNEPDLFADAAERVDPQDFSDDRLGRIAQEVWRLGLADQLSVDELMSSQSLAGMGGLLAELAMAGQQRGNCSETLRGAVDSLVHRRGRREIEGLKASKDDESLRRLDEHLRSPDARRHPRIS